MDLKFATKFKDLEKERILDLFMMYQMIELLLFMHLYPGEIITPVRDEGEFKKLDKEVNTKTLGKITAKYNQKFQNNEHSLKDLLETVTPQRNSFMHSFWIMIASAKDETEAMDFGKIVLDDFEKNANALLDAIYASNLNK